MFHNECELTSKMWIYAVHSQSDELIKYLEDKDISPPKNDYKIILDESIKCHHNDVSNFIIYNLIEEKDPNYIIENRYDENYYKSSFEFYNYCFFPENLEYKYMFLYLCGCDYYILVNLYLQHKNIDVNAVNIRTSIFYIPFKLYFLMKFKSFIIHGIKIE